MLKIKQGNKLRLLLDEDTINTSLEENVVLGIMSKIVTIQMVGLKFLS